MGSPGGSSWPDAAALRSTILVVDDEPLNRELIEAFLPGPRILQAEHGLQALEIFEQENVDLVLLDVMMPRMSGHEVCRRMKEMRRDELVPVIMLTALADQESRNTGLEAGADEYLSKPIDRRELVLRVGAFLRLRRQELLIRKQVAELQRLQALKDDLMSLVVHDLRNPLVGITSVLELVMEDVPRDAPFLPALGEALDAGKRVKEILDEALQVKLLEEGALPVSRSPVALEAVLLSAATALRSMARARQVSLSVQVESQKPLSLDGRLLQRAVENLISNAVKYTPGGLEVKVTGRCTPEGLHVEVADSGPGIPDELKPSLFAKYGSVEAQQGRARRGIGLGLYLVRLVAEGHGGAIGVEDRVGGGSVFRISIPMAPVA